MTETEIDEDDLDSAELDSELFVTETELQLEDVLVWLTLLELLVTEIEDDDRLLSELFVWLTELELFV